MKHNLIVEVYANFRFMQFDTNVERMAMRRAKRKSITLEDALKHYAGFEDEKSKLSFIQMSSLSGGKKFRLFICHR